MFDHMDCVVVGAGPAGLFFAHEYKQRHPDKQILVVDSGVSLRKRSCPLVMSGSCSQCSMCLAVYGSGGAGMYSDGKLSSFPAGSGLAAHFGSEEIARNLNYEVVSHIRRFTPPEYASRRSSMSEAQLSPLSEKVANSELELKSYDVTHMGTEGIQAFCSNFEDALESIGVDFLWRMKIVRVERFGEDLKLGIKNARGEEREIKTKRLVFATGKASGLLLRKHLISLGAGFAYNAIDLGVRVEVRRDAVQSISACHLDAKIKSIGLHDCSLRTFCICDGGYIVSCYYDYYDESERICTISGYSFKERKSLVSNFGLLVRREFPMYVDPVRTHLGIIRATNALSGHGGTVVQRYGDFRRKRATTQAGLNSNSVQSTLPSSTPVDLNWILPHYVSENIEYFLQKLKAVSPAIADDDTLLHAPVWENSCDRPQLSSAFETTERNVYVIGDATGIARGIVQAASTGLAAARMMFADQSPKLHVA